MQSIILNEKLRPKNFDDFIGHKDFIETLKSQIKNGSLQNYTFYGKAGGGKTTLAKIIMNQENFDSLYLNASDERGIDTIRGKIMDFASSMSQKDLKVVVLDEADFLLINSQAALRNVIERFSTNTRFILTCNYIERLIDPILSRCKPIHITPPNKVSIAEKISNYLETENIKFKPENMAHIINTSYPDIRQIINTLQFNIINGELKSTKSFEVESQYKKLILDELNNPKPKIKIIRQILLDSNINDYESTFRFLYDEAENYAPNHLGSIAMLVSEYQYKSQFKVDKEINIMACIYNIIQTIT